MKDLLDANVFIEAKNRYYAFDICPGFWDWMDHIVSGGDVLSIIMVRDELIRGKDDLAEWIEERRHSRWFRPVDDPKTQRIFAEIVASVQAADYRPAAKEKFLSGADPWLVAKAKTLGATVVTHEVASPDARKRVPLPNVCDQFNVPWKNTFEVLRALTASFTFRAD
jgi:hypothetical protein